jgi:TRAP transporter TAXI family solute receptor
MGSIKTFVKTNLWLAVAVVLIAIGLFQFVEPAPPRQITMATGDEDGYYHALGKYLQDGLQREGVDLRLVSTAGSSENMKLLADPDGPVSIAFVQSGMETIFDTGEAALASLGSLYYEPIWLFYRRAVSLDIARDLRGLRVAVGTEGSGTQALAEYLMAENGLSGTSDGFILVEAGGEEAVELLRSGDIDAAFFTVSPRSDTIRSLIDMPEIDFLDVRRSKAYTVRYPFLSSVSITEGLLDLARNIPPEDRTTLASTATLVVNDRFHPSLTPLVLELLSRQLRRGGMLEQPGEFPSARNVGFDLTKEAEHYFRNGPPFLLRYLPFWAASLVDRLIIFVVPLLVIIIPLIKLAGPLYRWRIRSRIYTWYRHLQEMESRLTEGKIKNFAEEKHRLDTLTEELASVDVPLSYADALYELKQHVEYVRGRLESEQAV